MNLLLKRKKGKFFYIEIYIMINDYIIFYYNNSTLQKEKIMNKFLIFCEML